MKGRARNLDGTWNLSHDCELLRRTQKVRTQPPLNTLALRIDVCIYVYTYYISYIICVYTHKYLDVDVGDDTS